MKIVSGKCYVIGCLAAATWLSPFGVSGQDVLVRPARGGALDTNAPMIHVDVFYDYTNNVMQAVLDTTHGVPKLNPLPPGYAFDSHSNYYVLTGKAYNLQYAWNPGGVFSPPAGAAVWVECVGASPELEVYDGPGNKNENPPRPYTPILGTVGSSPKWQWYGRMAHNACAVRNPTNAVLWAEYKIYFADAVTGDRAAYGQYTHATVRLTWTVDPVKLVAPARGGGLDTNSPMIHVDIGYDSVAKKLTATLDTTKGIPKMLPLPAGYAFDSRSNYYVLSGKAYNFQCAWNPGGVFAPPEGAAVWIERLYFSPGLENYDGPGNKMEKPARTYAPIFGTAGSPMIWKWYGRMAHNAFAVLNPLTNTMTAEFRVYFGDAVTGARDAYAEYGDATVNLVLQVESLAAPVFRFGATEPNVGAPLKFLNAESCITSSESVINLRYTNSGPYAQQFQCCIPMLAVPATPANGGPELNHAALGAQLEMQLVSLDGPQGGALRFWECGQSQPQFELPVGESAGSHRFCISQNSGAPGTDPFGNVAGRHFTASTPGLYCLGFQLVDASTNGPGGGPIHSPSPLYKVYLQVGATLASIQSSGSSIVTSFASEPGKTFWLEGSPALSNAAQWQVLAGPLLGTSRIQKLTNSPSSGPEMFYRLRVGP
jgi:hypothetical protein